MIKCKKCNNDTYIVKKVGPHMGAYCANCGRWIRWIKGKEVKDFEIDKEVYEDFSVYDIENDYSEVPLS